MPCLMTLASPRPPGAISRHAPELPAWDVARPRLQHGQMLQLGKGSLSKVRCANAACFRWHFVRIHVHTVLCVSVTCRFCLQCACVEGSLRSCCPQNTQRATEKASKSVAHHRIACSCWIKCFASLGLLLWPALLLSKLDRCPHRMLPSDCRTA